MRNRPRKVWGKKKKSNINKRRRRRRRSFEEMHSSAGDLECVHVCFFPLHMMTTPVRAAEVICMRKKKEKVLVHLLHCEEWRVPTVRAYGE